MPTLVFWSSGECSSASLALSRLPINMQACALHRYTLPLSPSLFVKALSQDARAAMPSFSLM